jgi:hypothetical protein
MNPPPYKEYILIKIYFKKEYFMVLWFWEGGMEVFNPSFKFLFELPPSAPALCGHNLT